MSGRNRSGIDEMIDETGLRARFILPGALCPPVFSSCNENAHAQRILLAIIWASNKNLTQGEMSRFRVPMSYLAVAAGMDRHHRYDACRSSVARLATEVCQFEYGAKMSVFIEIQCYIENGIEFVDWVFDQEFAKTFREPERFATMEIAEVCRLQSALEVYLYRQMRLVLNMRRKSFTSDVADLMVASGAEPERGFRRLGEKARRTFHRLADMMGVDGTVTTVYRRGSARADALTFNFVPRQ
jgi:hypothetical protein